MKSTQNRVESQISGLRFEANSPDKYPIGELLRDWVE